MKKMFFVLAVFMSVNASAQISTQGRGHEYSNMQNQDRRGNSTQERGHTNNYGGNGYANSYRPERGHNAYGHEYHHKDWYYGVPAATPYEVDMIISTVKKTSFDSQKLEVATTCLMLRPMYAEDIARVAKCFSFDNDRLKFLKEAYPNCVDKHNKRFLENSMTFMSGQRDIRDFMERFDREHR